MKKTMTLLLAVALIAGASALVTAQEGEMDARKPPMMTQGGKMDGKKGPDCLKCKMRGGMSAKMVAVDGGVVVMMGGKLLKYDNDLNLLKDVALPMDMMCPKGQGMDGMKGSMKGSGPASME